MVGRNIFCKSPDTRSLLSDPSFHTRDIGTAQLHDWFMHEDLDVGSLWSLQAGGTFLSPWFIVYPFFFMAQGRHFPEPLFYERNDKSIPLISCPRPTAVRDVLNSHYWPIFIYTSSCLLVRDTWIWSILRRPVWAISPIAWSSRWKRRIRAHTSPLTLGNLSSILWGSLWRCWSSLQEEVRRGVYEVWEWLKHACMHAFRTNNWMDGDGRTYLRWWIYLLLTVLLRKVLLARTNGVHA